MKITQEGILRTFGTAFRAARLRWHWWEPRECYVRVTPLSDRLVVEVARSFAALSENATDRDAKHSMIEDESLLELCEPLRAEFTREYHSWEVDEDGKVIT